MISKNLVGVAGEYSVCAELCKQGILALITPKNHQLIDVIASDAEGRKTVSIQVKTMSVGNNLGWKLGQLKKQNNPHLFFVLVDLHENAPNDYYIYRYDDLIERVEQIYNDYMSQPKKDGSARKEVGFRWFDHSYFTDDDRSRKNNWMLLGFGS